MLHGITGEARIGRQSRPFTTSARVAAMTAGAMSRKSLLAAIGRQQGKAKQRQNNKIHADT